MKKHIIWMIIGCALPLLLIFLAPALGLGSDTSLFIFIVAMFACHLLMPMHQHGGHEHTTKHDSQSDSKTLKKEKHAHQH
ncbi:hypothetical protein MKJ04_05100 [Pontibacter sp. E15-1]|uniref:hypothetical protein n=1 Tax=Pontibacter sp. E15-1 TaxID=2919918 RepID=UPI001F4FEA23|nr:hypothetical protein [Pontibacter sp. E15-1]MCJ8164210.1 hypothetical protein [Pontibacter sp. E15-1]